MNNKTGGSDEPHVFLTKSYLKSLLYFAHYYANRYTE